MGGPVQQDLDQMRAGVVFFESCFAADEWRLEPLDPRNLYLHLVGDNRLIWVTRDDYEPPLQSTGCGPRLRLPVYVAMIDGDWMVAR